MLGERVVEAHCEKFVPVSGFEYMRMANKTGVLDSILHMRAGVPERITMIESPPEKEQGAKDKGSQKYRQAYAAMSDLVFRYSVLG